MRTFNNGINNNHYYGKKCYTVDNGRNFHAQRSAGKINKKNNRQAYENNAKDEPRAEYNVNMNENLFGYNENYKSNDKKCDSKIFDEEYNYEDMNDDRCCNKDDNNDDNGNDDYKNNDDKSTDDKSTDDNSTDDNSTASKTTARSNAYLIIVVAIIAFILISKLTDDQLDFLATVLASVSGLLFLSISSTGEATGVAGVPL